MSKFISDLTQAPDMLGHAKGTGPQRTQHAVYTDQLPPCNHACPAGENIQAWLSLAREARYYEAWLQLVNDNPLPAIHGRVCYHPCEGGCNRTFLDHAVSIHSVERFLGDTAIEEGWQFPAIPKKTGKKIMVVGAGPSGLSAAYHLARFGHTVEMFEAGPSAGGMMHFGIPAYRLPRTIIAAEVARIEALGVKINLNYKVTDIAAEKLAGNFDAVFIAIGATIGKKTSIPARDSGKILDAVSFLRAVELGNAPKLGRRVAIYGGGNTAMDAARVAKRMGVDEAMIIYRRDRENMPAHDFEADEALSEGVKIHWLRTIKMVNQSSFTVEIMRLENGKPVPTGTFETIDADALILALGQDTDTGFLNNLTGLEVSNEGNVLVDVNMMTGCPGIFAGGDMIPSERTVAIATGHGKKAAKNINAWLQNNTFQPPKKHLVVGFSRLHVWYKTHAPVTEQPHIPPEEATANFEEIVGGIQAQEAQYEAERCLSCGNCFECDGCFGACPEKAIIKLGKGNRYSINYNLCTGCGVCYEQCPCHAIEMEPEEMLAL